MFYANEPTWCGDVANVIWILNAAQSISESRFMITTICVAADRARLVPASQGWHDDDLRFHVVFGESNGKQSPMASVGPLRLWPSTIEELDDLPNLSPLFATIFRHSLAFENRYACVLTLLSHTENDVEFPADDLCRTLAMLAFARSRGGYRRRLRPQRSLRFHLDHR